MHRLKRRTRKRRFSLEHLEHKKEKGNERAAILLVLFLVGLLLFGTAAGGQLTGEEKNGKEKAAIQTSG